MEIPARESFINRRGRCKPETERFWEKVHKSDGCWFWIAGRNKQGYGLFKPDSGNCQLAHRFSWELVNGKIPEGACLLHRCDCPPCVNPEHLFVGDRPQNTADMMNKGRFPVGERHWFSRLTDDDIREIRELRLSGISCREIGERFGVCQSNISAILRGERWAHVD